MHYVLSIHFKSESQFINHQFELAFLILDLIDTVCKYDMYKYMLWFYPSQLIQD